MGPNYNDIGQGRPSPLSQWCLLDIPLFPDNV